MMLSKKSKKKDVGNIFLGFAILMTGMTMMSGSVAPLAEFPAHAMAQNRVNPRTAAEGRKLNRSLCGNRRI